MRNLQVKDLEPYISAAQAATVNGPAIDIRHISLLGAVASITGVATTGLLRLQVANSEAPPLSTDWVNHGITVSMTTAQNYSLEHINLTFYWARFVYTQAAGTGTLTVKVSGKGF